MQLVLETVPLGASCCDPPGFVPEINRKHMGLVPPRPVKVGVETVLVKFSRCGCAGLGDAAASQAG